MKQQENTEKTSLLGSLECPIRCDGPSGERAYLDQLIGSNIGSNLQHLRYKRLGSVSSTTGLLDQYQVTDLQGREIVRLHFDMYHEDYVETGVPQGFVRIDNQDLEATVLKNMFGDTDIEEEEFDKRSALNKQYGPVQVDESNHGYVHAKAHRLLLCGPQYYARDDFLSYPLKQWNWFEIIEASKQLVQQEAGLYPEHPIVVSDTETLMQFWNTFHFDVQNLDVLEDDVSLLIEAEHRITNVQLQCWCCIRPKLS